MGRIVFAGAMSHVLDPDYYDHACGPIGRRMVEEIMAEIRAMGDRCVAVRPDALVIVADDHLNAFSFNAVPAFCVRIGTHVDRLVQDEAEAFDKVLESMPARYALHEALANEILERGMGAGFDLAFSWEAPLDHAFLSPLNTMYGDRPIPPLAPIWVNCFVAPQPTAARCFALGRHIARTVAASPWNVAIIGTGGLSHFPELALSRVGETDTVFDRKILEWLGAGEHESLTALTADELHKAGEHELLNWIVVAGAVSAARGAAAPVRAELRYFGELPRINLTAVEWRLA